MDDLVLQFISVPNVVLCIVIGFLVQMQRKIVESNFENFAKTKTWTEFFLPLGPLGTGMLITAFTSYPVPDMLTDSFTGRVFFGLVAGLGSGYVYRIAKKMLKREDINLEKELKD